MEALLSLHGLELRAYLYSLNKIEIIIGAFSAFASVYVLLAGVSYLFTKKIFPHFNIGKIIDPRPVKFLQIKSEIRYSLISIFIFALYGLVTLELEKIGLLTIQWQWTWEDLLLDMIIIILWNDLHFYGCHWLLHKKWFYRNVHYIHHQSKVPTPFSTYSFHWFEAFLLSSVMIILMPFRHLNIAVIIVYPVVSLFMNNIGHMNYAVFPDLKLSQLFSSCRRHTMHHTQVKGNYGFFLPHFDMIFNTRVENIDYDAPLPPLKDSTNE